MDVLWALETSAKKNVLTNIVKRRRLIEKLGLEPVKLRLGT